MTTINKQQVELSVHARSGRPMRLYPHQDKFFIESREDTEYTLEIKNNSGVRVEAVVAVDGLSVMTGKAGSFADRGYIINAWSKITIQGYRKDLEEVGAFKFTKKYQSYAASKGQASNTGVIALAVYREKYLPDWYTSCSGTSRQTITWPPNSTDWKIGSVVPDSITSDGYDLQARCTSKPTYSSKLSHTSSQLRCFVTSNSDNAAVTSNYCSTVGSTTPAENVSFDHGTTWGQKVKDKVVSTIFERESETPFLVQEVFYNSKVNLEAIGIKLVDEKLVSLPVGFPAQYAQPPIGWRG